MRIVLFLIFTYLTFGELNAQARRSSTTKKVDTKAITVKEDKISTESNKTSTNNGVKDVESSFLGKETLKNETKNNSMAKDNNIDSVKTPSIANTSAIAHGEANIKTEAAAKVYKYKADESQVDYYKDLRKKFEVEEKERKEKEAILAKEKAKKEDDLRNSRHLSEDQAPQFDKYREGAKNPIEKKTTAEEDYNKLFK